MKAYIPPDRKLTKAQMEAFEQLWKKRTEEALQAFDEKSKQIQDDAAKRMIILAVFTLWQTFHIGRDRMPEYLKGLNEYAEKALHNDEWVYEVCRDLGKIGIDFQMGE